MMSTDLYGTRWAPLKALFVKLTLLYLKNIFNYFTYSSKDSW